MGIFTLLRHFGILSVIFIASYIDYGDGKVCPPKFTPIGQKCYHFSKVESTWDDAHYKCVNMNSTLAIITKPYQEILLRQFINKHSQVLGSFERWIGGRFDWMQSRWIWGPSGKPLEFQGFSRMRYMNKEIWKWHCIILDPARQNKWSARNCVHNKRYVCQTTNISKKHKPKKKLDPNRCSDPNFSNKYPKFCQKHQQNAPSPLMKRPMKKSRTVNYNDFICPRWMILVGRKCYYFSTEQETFYDAHWACLYNNTKLAVIRNQLEEKILRGFLNGNFVEKHERWIGGVFNHHMNKWVWAKNNRELKFSDFDNSVRPNGDFIAITMDPRLDHRWNTKSLIAKMHFICQAKPKTVIKYEKEDDNKLVSPTATVIIQIDNETRPYN